MEGARTEGSGGYALLRPVGQGGMGVVYEALHREHGTRHAVKLLRTPGKAQQARLLREGRLQANVDHPNVLAVQEVTVIRGLPAVVTPFVDGPTLAVVLARGPLPRDVAQALFHGVCEGVAALHRANLVHRDLKPSNVLLDPSGERVVPKVADFGLVKELGAVETLRTATGMMGTPMYAAPEQLRDASRVGPSADVFALGAVWAELLTGHRPWLTGNVELTEVPADLRALVARCLSLDPALRPPDAAALLAELPPRPDVDLRPFCRGNAATIAADPPSDGDAPPIVLPAERDPFVGREAELAELGARIDEGRLVSVVGAGGAGKTRLATAFARRSAPSWAGGAFFCDLSEARDVDGVAAVVARVLDVPLAAGDPVRQLGNAIAARGVCLVVLDTFEHVRGLASSTLGRWLDRASEARFVVTSREVLGLAGENVLTLQPLGLDEARELFLIRAAQVKPGFTVREEERATVDELLQLLDGLPLAVELAAARVSLMPPSRLLSRMSDRFRLLASPQRSGRQATLRATLDWSWDLLSPDERAALAQLTVFAGGFTLEAAEEVLELAELWPTDAVQALLDKSLLRRASVERYDLLASVAEYASERLDELGLRRAAEDRHGTHFAHAGGDDALASLDRHGGTGRRQALAAERANLVAACRRAVARGDGEVAVPTLRAAWAVLELRGPVELGLELAHAVAALPTLGSGPRARALEVRGKAGHAAGRREEAVAALERAVALAREAGEVRLEAAALRALGNAHRESGEDGEARRCFEDALVLARSVGDAGLEGIVLGGLAALDLGRGRSEAARANFERALGLAREVGDRSLEGAVLNNLGLLDGAQDRVDQAFQRLRAALEISREIGSQRVEGQELANLGVLHLGRGQLAEATRSFDAALAVVRQVGNRTSEGSVLANLGVVHQLQGRLDEAREHYDAAMVVLREVSDRRTEATVLANLGALHREQGRPAEAAGCLEEALVLQRSLGDSATEGITLGELAVLHLEQDRIVEARACVERAEPLVRATGDGQTLGKLLCARVRLERRAGHADAASIALAEAESCAHRVQAGPDSELGRLLAQLR